jgi:hypothetical protein
MADTTGRIPVRTAPRGVDPASNQPFFYQGTGEFPLPQAGQPGRAKALRFLDDPYRIGDRNSPKYLSNLLRKKGKSTTNY